MSVSDNPEISLPENMGVAQAAEIRADLLKFLETDADISINGEAVQRVHAAGLQVLAALLKDRQQGGQGWHWSGTSPALKQAADSMGLTDLMQMPPDGEADQEKTKEQS